jgi:hypothetical protein
LAGGSPSAWLQSDLGRRMGPGRLRAQKPIETVRRLEFLDLPQARRARAPCDRDRFKNLLRSWAFLFPEAT